jgi:hypothetical protein
MRQVVSRSILVYLAGVLLAFPASAQDDPNNLGCLVETELPRFLALGPPPGPADVNVQVEVTIGAEGRPSAITLTPRPKEELLARVIEHYLRSSSTYDAKCSGKKVKLRFTFQVEGQPSDNPFTRTRFRPPNHFIISTQIQNPDFYFAPVAPKSQEGEKPKP